MKLKIETFKMALILCGIAALVASPALADNSSTFSCPAGYSCACEDCAPCNSGSFIVICACKPGNGVTCTVTNGTCNTSQCNACCSSSSTGTHCNYSGCTGQICPDNTSPQFGALPAPFLLASVGSPVGGALACADPSPYFAAQACGDCKSRTIDLGPEASGQAAQLLVPKDIPVDSTNVRLDLRSSGVLGGSYVLRNNSSFGLVTLITLWTFQVNDPKSAGTTVTEIIDSWATDSAFLPPGEEKDEELNIRILNKEGLTLHRVTGEVVYAEFDDGTKVGPGASSFGFRLHSDRMKVLSAYKQLLDKIQSGASSGEVARYMQTRKEFATLIIARGQNGLDWLVAEITKRRNLAP